MSSDAGVTTGAVPEPRANPIAQPGERTQPIAVPARLGSAPVPGSAAPRSRTNRADLARAVAAHFRMPGATDPAPDSRRLAAVTAWAGALGLGGMAIALRLLVSLFQADGGWYRPTVLLIGAVGLLATVGAFASIHRNRLPWILLGVGTAALFAAATATALA